MNINVLIPHLCRMSLIYGILNRHHYQPLSTYLQIIHVHTHTSISKICVVRLESGKGFFFHDLVTVLQQ